MKYSSSRRHRMNLVANYIRNHLHEPIDLDKLANIACLSKYQFIRAFEKHFQETPISQLWRIRLEYAARSLVREKNLSITNIAMNFGFASSQTFSNAFHRYYGVTPRSFRTDNPVGFASLENIDQYYSYAAIPINKNKYSVEIKHHAPTRIAYIRNLGLVATPKECKLIEMCDRLEVWAKAKGLWKNSTKMIGICPDNSLITPEDYFLYDLGIPVTDNIVEDDVVSIQTIPAGTFATMFVDSITTITWAWEWLISSWSDKNYVVSDFYETFPIIDGKYSIDGKNFEICIRLQPDAPVQLYGT